MVKIDWLEQRKNAKVVVYENELEQAFEHYEAKVMEIAARARREMLVPWLKVTNCEFLTGNGTWSVNDPSSVRYLPNGDRDWRSYAHIMNDDLPDWLDRLMRLEVEGSQGNSELALWMLDYTTRKTKNSGGLK